MVAFWDRTLARGRQGVDEDALPLRKTKLDLMPKDLRS